MSRARSRQTDPSVESAGELFVRLRTLFTVRYVSARSTIRLVASDAEIVDSMWEIVAHISIDVHFRAGQHKLSMNGILLRLWQWMLCHGGSRRRRESLRSLAQRQRRGKRLRAWILAAWCAQRQTQQQQRRARRADRGHRSAQRVCEWAYRPMDSITRWNAGGSIRLGSRGNFQVLRRLGKRRHQRNRKTHHQRL